MNLDRRHPLADWPNEDLKQVSFKPREEILKDEFFVESQVSTEFKVDSFETFRGNNDEMAPVAHQSRRIIPGVDIIYGDNSETPEVEEGENENVPTSETEPTTVEEGEL
jgi:hypothetical protein